MTFRRLCQKISPKSIDISPALCYYNGAPSDTASQQSRRVQIKDSAGWSSPVARRAHNPKVVGSNPAPATTNMTGCIQPVIFLFVSKIYQTVKKSRPADMCGWTGHIQGNLALRVCEPRCGECAVQRQILSPGTAKLRRVLRTKQPKRSRGSGLPFASPLRRAQQKQGTATTRGKEFLSRDCGQKWVSPGACRFSTR